jgi:hypothetical protein
MKFDTMATDPPIIMPIPLRSYQLGAIAQSLRKLAYSIKVYILRLVETKRCHLISVGVHVIGVRSTGQCAFRFVKLRLSIKPRWTVVESFLTRKEFIASPMVERGFVSLPSSERIWRL